MPGEKPRRLPGSPIPGLARAGDMPDQTGMEPEPHPVAPCPAMRAMVRVRTRKRFEVVDLIAQIADVVARGALDEGICTVFAAALLDMGTNLYFSSCLF